MDATIYFHLQWHICFWNLQRKIYYLLHFKEAFPVIQSFLLSLNSWNGKKFFSHIAYLHSWEQLLATVEDTFDRFKSHVSGWDIKLSKLKHVHILVVFSKVLDTDKLKEIFPCNKRDGMKLQNQLIVHHSGITAALQTVTTILHNIACINIKYFQTP